MLEANWEVYDGNILIAKFVTEECAIDYCSLMNVELMTFWYMLNPWAVVS